MGKMLILFGVVLIAMGLLLTFAEKIPGIGRLPGDIYIRKGNMTFYFPVVTSILVSLVLTLLLNVLGKK